MFQALASLLFLAAGFFAIGAIALMLRSEWAAVSEALGLPARRTAALPVARVRNRQVRRAVMLRVELQPSRRHAAA